MRALPPAPCHDGRVSPPRRLLPAVGLVCYVGFLAVVLTELSPTIASEVVRAVETSLERGGAPAVTTERGRVEFVLNVLMFAPIVVLAGLTFPRQPWASWVVYAFVASCLVELGQGLFLPPRSAQMSDVVANTLGALLGAVTLVVARWVIGRRRPPPGRVTPFP